MGRIFTIGEALIDFIPHEINRDISEINNFTKMAGGAPANVAVAASKLGSETYFIGMLGNDPFGDFLIKTLASYKVKTDYVFQTNKANTSLAFVFLKDDGQREFSFYRNPGADMLLDIEDVKNIEFQSDDYISFCSVDLIDAPVKKSTKYLLDKANKKGSKVVFDPNLRFNLWEDLNELKDTVLEFINYCQFLKVSDDELEFITGYKDEDKAIEFIRNKYDCNIILTKGSKGAKAFFGDIEVFEASPKVKALDTTGAGDSFLGAFLHYMNENNIDTFTKESLKSILKYANKAASISVTRHGAMASYVTKEELE